jgi:mRNA-degrading endonuclease HigB of HigAB toxin-antitoxin module
MHINTQIDILITKSQLEIINGKHETAENTLQKISYIVANDNFDSQYDAKRYQAQV